MFALDDEMIIRQAVIADASSACETMRRSISELCVADHGNDLQILDRWLANKTVETFTAWVTRRDHSLLVAVEKDSVLCVGAVTDAGEITLNYVSPNARFCGVSSAMVSALEARAADRGNRQCTLLSTETAHRFYQTRGYLPDGLPKRIFGTGSGYPMMKNLPQQK